MKNNILGGREKIDRIRQKIGIGQIENRYQIDRKQILDKQKIDIR